VAGVVQQIATPSILLVEAPMGEGKTRGGLLRPPGTPAHLGHRGLYVALPTKATGNAMLSAPCTFLQERQVQRPIDLQLLHGAVLLNDKFQSIRLGQIHDTEELGQIRAGEWFHAQEAGPAFRVRALGPLIKPCCRSCPCDTTSFACGALPIVSSCSMRSMPTTRTPGHCSFISCGGSMPWGRPSFC